MFTTGDLLLNLYVFLYGLFWAVTMASAEGEKGWGGTLASRQLNGRKWYNSFLKIFTLGRPLNRLPLFAIITFVISFFLPVVWYYSKDLFFSLSNWGELTAYFAIFAIHEDFLWFLVNPYFGIRRFKKQRILWHPRWWLGLPIDYWIGIFVFTFCGILSRGVIWWFTTLTIQLALVFLATLVSKRIIK